MNDHVLLERYLLQAITTIPGSTSKVGEMVLRCNICGDSKKSMHSKRGRLLLIEDKGEKYWVYKCWNGGCEAFGRNNSWAAWRWLKKYFPYLYQQYTREIFRHFKVEENNEEDPIAKEIKALREKTKKESKIGDEKNIVKFFKPILSSNDSLFVTAREYCKKRKIPEEIWKKFFVCIDGKYRERLIIPYYNDKGQIYYWQGRTLTGKEPKYLNRKANRDYALYNYSFIDKSKPVIILEGPIDSMFVENSVATGGLNITNGMEVMLENYKRFWLCDNDEAGKLSSKQYLKNEDHVFRWDLFISKYNLKKDIKDINESIMSINTNRLTIEELLPFFTNNYYDTIYF